MTRKYQELSQDKVFLDRDKDGITDSVGLRLHLGPSCSHPLVLSSVMNLSACLGFETMAINLPLIRDTEQEETPFCHHLYIGKNDELRETYSRKAEGNHFLRGNDETSLARSVNRFAFSLISGRRLLRKKFFIRRDRKREGFNLLNPFSTQGFYCASSRMDLPILFPYKIILFSHLGLSTAIEASHFAARLGLETLSLSLPLALPLEKRTRGMKSVIYVGRKKDLSKIGLGGLKDIFESRWDSGIFLLPSKKRIPDVLVCGKEKGLRNILKYLSLLSTDSKGVNDPTWDTIRISLEDLRKWVAGKESQKIISPKKVIRDYIIPDEKGEIFHLLSERLKSRRTKPDSVEIQIFLARPEKAREEFQEKIEGRLNDLGIPKEGMKVTVLNAYKPGLSWMREVVLKEIAWMKSKVDRVEIAFKEFRESGFEEPIRWLQEIYPVDEIFAKGLSIPKAKIKFKKDSRLRETYRVRAWNGKKLTYENQFSPRWIEQPYLFPFPRLGRVHPTTGWVKMTVNGEEVVNQRVKTGVERIWDIYQSEILSQLGKEANSVLSRGQLSSSQPIFEELRFDIYFDYPEEVLGVDEEKISPLESLHEDLYFVTLDFFSRWTKKRGLKGISLGRVLPVIHPNSNGKKGRMRFTLVHPTTQNLPAPPFAGEIKFSLKAIVFRGSKVGLDLFLGGGKKEDHNGLRKKLESYRPLPLPLNKRSFRIDKILEEDRFHRKGFRLLAFGSHFPRKKRPPHKNLSGKTIRIPVERPIGYREGVRLVKSLAKLPGIHAFEEGTSSGGLPLFSLENSYPLMNSGSSHFVSHAKKILFRPTLFINCRHHANEVSSTNAGLRLSHLLATRPPFRELLKRANVVINPMENVDGVEILEEMQQLTPTDKLHAGRYNKAGKEYYYEYFNTQTPFGEARIKPTLWQRWLPDICIDNHGFPSHEWEQPFSGYAPFRFREFWIPRVLFYLYLPFLDEQASSSRRINSKILGDWIVGSLSKEKEVKKWNQIFSSRYLKYRQQWLRNNFQPNAPVPCLPLQKRLRRANYSYRYPHITTVDFITEVADETAQGKFLKTCVNAHLQTNLSILKLLSSFDTSVKKMYRYQNGQTLFMWFRERPLDLRSTGKKG